MVFSEGVYYGVVYEYDLVGRFLGFECYVKKDGIVEWGMDRDKEGKISKGGRGGGELWR